LPTIVPASLMPVAPVPGASGTLTDVNGGVDGDRAATVQQQAVERVGRIQLRPDDLAAVVEVEERAARRGIVRPVVEVDDPALVPQEPVVGAVGVAVLADELAVVVDLDEVVVADGAGASNPVDGPS
jgi:hypothetical protein